MTTPFKSGTEFVVNTTLTGDQYQPTITALADGRFVVAWRDESLSPDDTSGTAIRAQVFNADGSTSGAEFLVNTTTASLQFDPTITALADGRFVVVWTDISLTGGDTSGDAIRAQVFNADGSTSGGEFLVNTTVSGFQNAPTITALADGRFVVAWTDDSNTGGDTDGDAIRAQMFNADGSASGGEFLVNTATANDQFGPTITVLADGRFVVAWADLSTTGTDTSGAAIRAQVFNADGSASGGEFVVNTTTLNFQSQPTITALADGRFVVAWTDDSKTVGDTTIGAIRAQVFNADGSASGGEFLLNTTVAFGQSTPMITALADGRFAVAWVDGSNGVDADIRGQIFDPREAAVVLNGTLANDGYVGTIFGDVMRGSFGDDNLRGAAGDDVVAGEWGNDAISGGSGNDRITGDDGDDVLSGGTGSDVLDGGLGNDTINGGVGADAMIGGAGNDRYIVDVAADVIVEAAGAAGGIDIILSSSLLTIDLNLYANVENLTRLGGLALEAYGSNLNNVMTGNIGDDFINGGGGDDKLIGGDGSDQLEGSTGNDTLTGGAGQDFLFGGGNNDSFNLIDTELQAGEVYDGGTETDQLILTATQSGTIFDLKQASVANIEAIVLLAAASVSFVDLLLTASQTAGISQMTLTTGGIGEYLNITMQDSVALDLSGMVVSNFNAAHDSMVIQGDGDAENIIGSAVGETIETYGGIDTLDGGSGNDTLFGDAQNDLLLGGLGDDFLYGGTGNDTLDGVAGFDTMFGGTGRDVFVVGPGLNADTYTVKDFADGFDKVDLSAYGFASVAAARAAFVDVGANVVFGAGSAFIILENMTKAQITAADLIL